MDIVNKLHKRIKTIATATGEYPKEIEITPDEYAELLKNYYSTMTFATTDRPYKFEGVSLIIKPQK